jgi:hypothetical protein
MMRRKLRNKPKSSKSSSRSTLLKLILPRKMRTRPTRS